MLYRLVSHLAWREIDDETCVVDLKRKTMYGLNASGGVIWKRLQEGLPVPGSPAALDRAVGGFLARLEELGLVTREAAEETGTASPAAAGSGAPPQVLWQEEIRSFGQSCQLVPGNDQCDAGGPMGPP